MHDVHRYAHDVVEGRVVASKWVRLQCERHLRDLKESLDPQRGIYFDEEDADDAALIFECVVLFKGRSKGRPFHLEPWQVFIVGSLFGWRRTDGARRFRKAYIEIARKNGKTHLAAVIAIILFIFDGEGGSEVYSAATTRKQASITFAIAKALIRSSPAIRRRVRMLTNVVVQDSTDSKMHAVSSQAQNLDGLEPHGLIIDEFHAHRTRDVLDTLEEGTAARDQPLTFITTTAGEGDGKDSPCWDERAYGTKVLERKFDDDQLFPFIATLDEGDDWRDSAVWIKANPNLGVTVTDDYLQAKVRTAVEKPTAQRNLRRKHFNEWIGIAKSWLKEGKWQACAFPVDKEALRGRRCFGAFDLSLNTDLTGVVLLFEPIDGEPMPILATGWIPEEQMWLRSRRDAVRYDVWHEQGWIKTTPGDVIDHDFIREDIMQMFELYDIVEMAYDPHLAGSMGGKLLAEGLTVVPFSQAFSSMGGAVLRAEAEVLKCNIAHGGNPVLAEHIANAVPLTNPGGLTKLDKSKTPHRMDLAVCYVMAIGRWMLHADQPTGSIYEERGPLIL